MRRIFLFGLVVIVLGVVYIGLGAKCPLDKKDKSGSSIPQHNFWTPITLENAPSPRKWASAVWTGNKLIVWGGEDENTYVNTGGIYDTISNNWAPITTTGVPTRRASCPAVWTGNPTGTGEMIIWGGSYGGPPMFNDGIYNPNTDSWRLITTTNTPELRTSHTAIWTGSPAEGGTGEMIIWGGLDSFGVNLNTGYAYDPVLDTWSTITTTNAPISRSYHTAVWTGSEMIIWGGYGAGPTVFNTGARYNPITDIWTPITTTDAPLPRCNHTAIWTGSEMIVWGGAGASSGTITNTGARYNPITDIWTPITTTDAPLPRCNHTAIWTGSEMIVWGGYGADLIVFNTGGIYDPQTDTWSDISITNAPSARLYHIAVWTGTPPNGTGEMIIWGGGCLLYTDIFNTGARYKP
jgi:N-acetylneuraminic acid mutarotase